MLEWEKWLREPLEIGVNGNTIVEFGLLRLKSVSVPNLFPELEMSQKIVGILGGRELETYKDKKN